jgi:hypothetical protein
MEKRLISLDDFINESSQEKRQADIASVSNALVISFDDRISKDNTILLMQVLRKHNCFVEYEVDARMFIVSRTNNPKDLEDLKKEIGW